MFAIRVVVLAFVLHLRSAVTSFKITPRSCFTSFDQSKPTKMHIVSSVLRRRYSPIKPKIHESVLQLTFGLQKVRLMSDRSWMKNESMVVVKGVR
ncbi:unnamed protein product [Vicia faba]|nr:unnamed protein product [Vicia faba]